MQMDLHDNWKDWFFPLSLFKNEQGILDTTQIKSVLFTSLDDGPGSFIIDNIKSRRTAIRRNKAFYGIERYPKGKYDMEGMGRR